MGLPAFSRTIERRGSAVNDDFPALQAKTWRVGFCDRFHCEDPGCRGLKLRAVPVTRDLCDRRLRVACKNVAKIGSTKKITPLIVNRGRHRFVSDAQYVANRLKNKSSIQTCQLKA